MLKLTEAKYPYGEVTVGVSPSEVASVHYFNRATEICAPPMANAVIRMKDGRRIIVSQNVNEIIKACSEVNERAAFSVGAEEETDA